ncbi:hypothetical protein GW17_00034464 [Ensete ventricosum]|nr:hypothetical protein GW17_00034464 [Ensete ventricosum]
MARMRRRRSGEDRAWAGDQGIASDHDRFPPPLFPTCSPTAPLLILLAHRTYSLAALLAKVEPYLRDDHLLVPPVVDVDDQHGVDPMLALPMQGVKINGSTDVVKGGRGRAVDAFEEGHG